MHHRAGRLIRIWPARLVFFLTEAAHDAEACLPVFDVTQ